MTSVEEVVGSIDPMTLLSPPNGSVAGAVVVGTSVTDATGVAVVRATVGAVVAVVCVLRWKTVPKNCCKKVHREQERTH